MIYKKKANADKIYKKLKGFVNRKTVEKYIDKNQKLTQKLNEKNCKFHSNKLHTLLIFLILFCGFLFFYHLYTLWKKYKNNKKNNNTVADSNPQNDLNIVPPSGIY
jgi:hypothetical protein